MWKNSYLSLAVMFITLPAIAQQTQWDRPMQLKSCKIDIKSDQFTATTFIEMEFYNPNKQEIEGLYRFELKPGQVITAFQLDLHGKYRDGTIEEKWKATNAYNTIVGKRIDPALLTMEYADHYRLNIYPVPGRSSRKITMTIQQLLTRDKASLQYFLPLNVADTVQDFSLSISADVNTVPVTKPGLIASLAFSYAMRRGFLRWTANKVMLRSPIAYSVPISSKQVTCVKEVGDKTHFALQLLPSIPVDYAVNPKRVTVYWDASGAQEKRDLPREIGFLKQFINYHRIEQLTIIPFNQRLLDTAVFYNENGFQDAWTEYLQNIEYDGATQLGNINLAGNKADMTLLFTDGNNTYGRSKPKISQSLVYCIYSSNAADMQVLQAMVGSTGGRVIDVGKMSMAGAVQINSRAENWLIGIRSTSGKAIVEQLLPLRLDKPLLLNGVTPNLIDTIIFEYGNNGRVNYTEKVVIFQGDGCTSGATDRITMLNNFDRVIRQAGWEDILDFGLNEKIVTPNTAYIVLERVEDYVKYNIEPPKELEEECARMNYVKKDRRSERKKNQAIDESRLLSEVIIAYNARIRAWDPARTTISPLQVVAEQNAIARSEEFKFDSETVSGNTSGGLPGSTSALEEVVVVGYSQSLRKDMAYSTSKISARELQGNFISVEQALQGRVPGLHIAGNTNYFGEQASVRIRGAASTGNGQPLYVLDGVPVNGNINDIISMSDVEGISVMKDAQAGAIFGSRAANGAIVITSKKGRAYYRPYGKYRLKDMQDVEYLAQMKKAWREEKMNLYTQLREEYRTNAGFYFDIAQHFFDIGWKKDAKEILMNAAEVSNGSYQVLRAIGYVLESWKQFDEAAHVFNSLVQDQPANLVCHRDLAWNYYQAGRYQEAVNQMYHAISDVGSTAQLWNRDLKALMLTELNAMIEIHKDSLNLTKVPSNLIQSIPADLRIILDCNKSNIGMAKIKEPDGNVLTGYPNYNNKYGVFTSYTNGISEFQVKQAKKGKYKISLNYYDYYSYPGNIPSYIRMVVFRNFGRKEQAIAIENVVMDNQYGEVEIGEVKW